MWSGKVTAGYVLTLVEQLHLNPDSRVRMIALGGDLRFIGWDTNADIAADRYDQLVQVVASFSGDNESAVRFYPRPGSQPAEEVASTENPHLFAQSIDDFDPAAFMKVIAGK